MNCEQARNLFDAYFDGELSSALAAELDTHRLHCASCRQEMALMEVAGHVIASSDSGSYLRDDFADRLLACIDTVEPKRGERFWLMRIGVPLAAAACITLAVTMLNSPEPQVLSQRQEAKPDPTISSIRIDAPTAPAATGAADVDQAAVAFQQTVSQALQRTRQTSQSLVRFGNMTLLQVIDALQLEQLRSGEPNDAPEPSLEDETTPDDADDIEDI